MTPAQMDEARRWTALRGWRWMPGMLDSDGYRVLADYGDGSYGLWAGGGPTVWSMKSGEVPDVTDPATRGCLLALAREITWRPHMGTDCEPAPGGRWISIWLTSDGRLRFGPPAQTETGALLAACEAHERGEAP